MKLEFDSYNELLALHKSVMAVKFDKNKCLPEALGSPLLAKQAFRIFELMVEHFRTSGNEKGANNWIEWQRADLNRIEAKRLVEWIEESQWWSGRSTEEKRELVANFMAPLILKENDVVAILSDY